MATRVSKGEGNISESTLIKGLRRKASKKEVDTKFVGLQRSNALSDLEDPSKSINNILRKISITNSSERELYGREYNFTDWSITEQIINNNISNNLFSSIAGASVQSDGEISITPRLRVQDRVNQLSSFYGEGSIPDLYNGPDATFYRSNKPELIGYVKFSFDNNTGAVSVVELKALDKTTNITVGQITVFDQDIDGVIVVDLDSYDLPTSTVDLGTSSVSLKIVLPNTWTVFDQTSLDSLVNIKNSVGEANFPGVFFRITRPYSSSRFPGWFRENPISNSPAIGGVDSLDPVVSPLLLESLEGQIVPVKQRGYWFTGEYVEERWTEQERTRMGRSKPLLTEDSNMRWVKPPDALAGEDINWGVRWVGYLRIEPGIYCLEVQTNATVKINIKLSDTSVWEVPMNTNIRAPLGAAVDWDGKFLSPTSFNTDLIQSQYKYVTGPDPDDWVAHVPISIRLWHGGPDKADLSKVIPTEPDLFIKTTKLSVPTNFYHKILTVTLSGTEGSQSIASPSLALLISILEDPWASVDYFLTEEGGVELPERIPLALTTDGVGVVSTTEGVPNGVYTLVVAPLRTSEFENNLLALWKGRILSPPPNYKISSDLTDSSFVADIQKVGFDLRPPWWRISEGHPYDRALTPSRQNTPLDGLLPNSFKPTMNSDGPGLGLYGNGLGVFSNRPSLIIGEARYDSSEELGSNYTGVRLTSNAVGEGGNLIINAVPINNALGTGNVLGVNDLGGSPNHLTAAAPNLVGRVIQLYLCTDIALTENYNKYYTSSNLATVAVSDDPTVYGLPPFSSLDWLTPINVNAVAVANDVGFTTGVSGFVAPLSLLVERVTVNAQTLLSFSSTLDSIKVGGSDVAAFSGKFIRFYTKNNPDYQYERVDNGEGVSLSDVLKLTYDGGVLDVGASEVPEPPLDRVSPWGFDEGDGEGLCYPPYVTTNPLLLQTAVSDNTLYAAGRGNFDVIWGDSTKPELGGKVLEITKSLEFLGAGAVREIGGDVSIPTSTFTSRLQVNLPLPPTLDEDVMEYYTTGEKVKDSYYLYVKV